MGLDPLFMVLPTCQGLARTGQGSLTMTGQTPAAPGEQARFHSHEAKTDEVVCASSVFVIACLSIYDRRMRPLRAHHA